MQSLKSKLFVLVGVIFIIAPTFFGQAAADDALVITACPANPSGACAESSGTSNNAWSGPLGSRVDVIQVGKGAPIIVPKALHAQIFAVLTLAAEGTPSAVDRLTLTLTTQQVAERLGVSRPHVVSLIESRKLVGTKVGTHRRVLLADLEAYQSQEAASRSKALTSLVRHTRKLGLGY